MSKRKQKLKTNIDFQFGVFRIIPSTQQAYHKDAVDLSVRVKERKQTSGFDDEVSDILSRKQKDLGRFPTNNELFVFILQFFVSEQEYRKRDIDNMAKTILDSLKGKFYHDDKQVKTLLISKKIDKRRVPQDFAYIAIKELKTGEDLEILKVAGIHRAITFYQENLKK